MALTWSVERIKDHERITTSPWPGEGGGDQWHPITSKLVMLSMVCGYGVITNANAKDVAERVAMYELAFPNDRLGFLGQQGSGVDYISITYKDVLNHVGLSTNASTLTRAQWVKKLGQLVEREAEAKVRRDQRPEAVSAFDQCAGVHARWLASQNLSLPQTPSPEVLAKGTVSAPMPEA